MEDILRDIIFSQAKAIDWKGKVVKIINKYRPETKKPSFSWDD